MRCRLTQTTIRTGTRNTIDTRTTLGATNGHARAHLDRLRGRSGSSPAPPSWRASGSAADFVGIVLHDLVGSRCRRIVLQDHTGYCVAHDLPEGGVVHGVGDRLA